MSANSHKQTTRESAYLAGFTTARAMVGSRAQEILGHNPYPFVRGNKHLIYNRAGSLSLRRQWRAGAEFGMSL